MVVSRGSLGVSLVHKQASVRRTEFLLLCVATPRTSAGSGLLWDPRQHGFFLRRPVGLVL